MISGRFYQKSSVKCQEAKDRRQRISALALSSLIQATMTRPLADRFHRPRPDTDKPGLPSSVQYPIFYAKSIYIIHRLRNQPYSQNSIQWTCRRWLPTANNYQPTNLLCDCFITA
ncbi:hypothetical protein SNK03_001785 [Fusarium graminearum]